MSAAVLRSILFAVLAVIALATAVRAQAREPVVLTPEAVEGRADLTDAGWKYRPGDDASWSSPTLDDDSWETLRTTAIGADAIPASGWRGIGWFRLRVQVDSRLVGRPVGLVLGHWGASQLFVDGRLVNRFGTVGATSDVERPYSPQGIPVVIAFDTPGIHVLAVRYSCTAMNNLAAGWGLWHLRWRQTAGFSARLSNADHAIRDHAFALEVAQTIGSASAALIIALGAVYGLLFLFNRKATENLAFSISACALGVAIALETILQLGHYGLWFRGFQNSASPILIALFTVGFLAFLHILFPARSRRYLWAYGGAWTIVCLFQAVHPNLTAIRWLYGLLLAFFVVDSLRLIGLALWRRLDGARIIGIGALLNTGIPAYNALMAWGAQIPGLTRFSIAITSQLGMVTVASIHLARRAGRTSRELEKRVDEVQELSQRAIEHERREAEVRIEQERERAEHARRLKELEEARKLQMSLLPASMPELAHLDIAAYMKTATEVGGDYYDVHVTEDGCVTLVVGDATGHGLRAGTLVTAAKSLFRAYAGDPDLTRILRESSRVLQEMNLGSLFMALQIVRIADGHFTFASAGMPPAVIYRAATGKVEAVSAPAPPLGVAIAARYSVQEHPLAAGDVLLLMSDGLPERFSPAGEMLGYEQIPSLLQGLAGDNVTASTIVRRLVETGEAWAEDLAQDDDVTLLAIKRLANLTQ